MFPCAFNNYFESFIGGGAVCFSLQNVNSFISDLDPVVVNVYHCIRDNFDNFTLHFRLLGETFKNLPNDVLARNTLHMLNSADVHDNVKAVLFLFITQTVYSGQVKRSSGVFTKQNFYNRLTERKLTTIFDNCVKLNRYLQTINISCGSFVESLADAVENDFCYLDPPYYYEQGQGNVAYDAINRERERMLVERERDEIDVLTRRGVKVGMSMSDYPFVRSLFANYTIHEVTIRRSLRPGAPITTELYICNY